MRQEHLIQAAENEIKIQETPTTHIDIEDYLYEQHRDKTRNKTHQEEQKQETPHTATFSRGCPNQ